MTEKRWELLPYYVLRSTGFAFDMMTSLAFTETAMAIDTVLACEEELAALSAAVRLTLAASSNVETLKLRRRCWDRVARQQRAALDDETRRTLESRQAQNLDHWDALLSHRATLEAQARTTFAAEIVTRRQALREIVSNIRFQEAVWLSSPQMYTFGLLPFLARWHPEQRLSEVRRVERQLVSYLQRFCAKNDTASFFGPINYGDFAPRATSPMPGPGAEHVRQRAAFIAYWGVVALCAALASDKDIRPYLRPRLSPLCTLDIEASQAIVGGQKAVPLTAPRREVVRLADGARTVLDIAHAIGHSLDQTFSLLDDLARAHIIRLELEVPVTNVDPIAWLLKWVQVLPDECMSRSFWCERLGTVQHIQERFAQASFHERQTLLAQLEQLFATTTQQPARRGAGDFYADRLLIYEECQGGLTPMSLGPACAAALHAQLAPALDVFAAHAIEVNRQLQAYGADLLCRLAPDGRMPLLRAIMELRHHPLALDAFTSPWEQAIRIFVQAHAQERQVQLDEAMLPPIDKATLAESVLLTSPDIMFLAQDISAIRDGDIQVVLSECHDTVMVWGWPLYFHSQRSAVEAAAARLLRRAQGRHQIANVLTSKRVKIIPFEYPGPTIEVLVASEKPRGQRIAITEVETGIVDGRPALRAANWPCLYLYNGELSTLAHRLFALPRVVPFHIDLGVHTPRIMLGKMVIQREQWRLTREMLIPHKYRGTSFELMISIRRAARQLGLPRFVFVRVASEPKPVFIDLNNYFLLELLDHLLPEGAEALFSEMLPTPDQLWLRDDSGAYCTEIRLSMGHVGDDNDFDHRS
jgi:hypothetical protein